MSSFAWFRTPFAAAGRSLVATLVLQGLGFAAVPSAAAPQSPSPPSSSSSWSSSWPSSPSSAAPSSSLSSLQDTAGPAGPRLAATGTDSGPGQTRGRRSDGFDAEAFLLNALLVPSLDADLEPLRWADPLPRAGCHPGSRVLVDGQPLAVGAAVPARSFIVDWTADRCQPFGEAGPRLHGTVRLMIERRGDRFEAQVIPMDMVVQTAGAGTKAVSARRAMIEVGPGVQP